MRLRRVRENRNAFAHGSQKLVVKGDEAERHQSLYIVHLVLRRILPTFYLPRATEAGFEITPKSGRSGEKNDPRSVPAFGLRCGSTAQGVRWDHSWLYCGTSTRRVPVDQ